MRDIKEFTDDFMNENPSEKITQALGSSALSETELNGLMEALGDPEIVQAVAGFIALYE